MQQFCTVKFISLFKSVLYLKPQKTNEVEASLSDCFITITRNRLYNETS